MALSQAKTLDDDIARPDNPFALFQSANDDTPTDQPVVEDGVLRVEHPDGSITIDFDPKPPKQEESDNEFDANLADQMGDDELTSIASDLVDGINRDLDSRREWMETRARGIEMLGIHLKQPSAGAATNGPGTVAGISSIDHPLILEATINFQATARAELLPAAGPVKVRNDAPTPPKVQLEQTNAQEQLKNSLSGQDELAQALERDFNHYLTSTAVEYVPDTDRMLFYVGFGGDGFKKVYNCPLRRRPVSESVDAEDLIVSNAATDLKNCGRVTHLIKMRKSVLRRMQILGVYRDVDLAPPAVSVPNPVEQKEEEISGIRSTFQRPEDRDYELYEVYCELDIDEFAPSDFKGKGLPLPYRVTIERESQQVLDIRRNWKEDDDQCLPKQFFVQFPLVRGLGFYGLGFIHILGNITKTLTATWRETIDAGMFASFPGFIYSKTLGRQLTNEMRIPPGGGLGVDMPPNTRIQDAIMPVPYKEPTPAFTSFITHVEEVGRRLATTGSVNVGEGKQDAPVGTTLALIEQATKVMDSAHKRLHAAQAEEFALLKDRFRDDPEAFWRFNRHPAMQWQKEQFVEALNNCNLVPVADPNNPTSLHRIAKAMAIKELQKSSPELYDPIACDMRVMQIVGIDPQGLFRPQAAPPPPDPRLIAIQEKARSSKEQSAIQLADSQQRAEIERMKIADKERDRNSRERLEAMRIELEHLKLAGEGVEKGQQAYVDNMIRQQDIYEKYVAEHAAQEAARAKEIEDTQREDVKYLLDLKNEQQRHEIEISEKRAMQREKLENDRELAKWKAKAQFERANKGSSSTKKDKKS
jgi:hypothetical protein